MHRISWSRRLLLAGVLAFSTAAAAAAPLEDAARMLDAGDGQGAWAALEPLQAERAGDPAYDMLLGRAALASDRPSEALFAFERAAAVNPEDAGVKLWMARAYLAVRDLTAARRELDAARARGLSPADAGTADAVDAELHAASRAPEGLSGYLEGFAGYDSNVNAATADQTINVGGRLATLDPRGVEQSDVFLGAAGKIDYRHRVNARTDLELGGYARERLNTSENDFDITTLAGNATLKYRQGLNTWSGTVLLNRTLLDHDGYRTSAGVGGGLERRFGRGTRLRAFAEIAHLSYDGSQSARNANRLIGGVGLDHAYTSASKPAVSVTLYGGTVDETGSNVPHLGYDLYGARLAGAVSFSSAVSGYAAAVYERRSYGGTVPGFTADRDDNQYGARAGVHWQFMQNWRLTPEMAYVRNDSNTSVNDYDRAIARVAVRRSFD